VEGSCEHGSEPSSFIKCCDILQYLSDYLLLKKDLAPWNWLFNVEVSEKSVLGSIYEPERNKINRRRKLHNEVFHNFLLFFN
jgi:tRNA(Ser,Leu) C12 N-acetylase TAN1